MPHPRLRHLVLLLSAQPCLLSPVSAAGRQSTARAEQYVIQFGAQLGLSGDLRLGQSADSASVIFKCRSTCKPVSGSALHLFLQHSAALDGGRSFLAINLNYGVLRSLQLDEKSEKMLEVVVPLPAGQLKSENELKISVEQYPLKADAKSGVWTLIGARSYILVQCERHPALLDLRLLPAPLLDPYSYGSKHLAVLMPDHPASATLEATALLVANLSARLSPDPLAVEVVRSARSVRSPLLVVGTPWEQPQWAALQGRAPFVLYEHRGAARIAPAYGPSLGDGEGAAGLFTPSEAEQDAVLCVVGNSPGAVLRAARAVCRQDPGIRGRLARIAGNSAPPPRQPRTWNGFMPPANRFTLADLGFKEKPLDSQNGFSTEVTVRAVPDAAFLGYGHQMTLELYAKPYPGRAGTLSVFFNRTLVGRLDMSKVPPGRVAVKIPIAASLLAAGNVLKLALSPPNEGGPLPEVALLPDTALFLPRDYAAELPDLSLLRYHLYPFSLLPDLSDTVVLVPNDIDWDTFSMLMEFADFLGRAVPSDTLDFRVRQKVGLTDADVSSVNLINFLIDSGQILAPTQRGARAKVPFGAPYVRETISPGDSTKFILTIAAGSTGALARLSHELFFGGALKKLSGDTAYWSRRDIVCLNQTTRRKMRTVFYLTDLEIWLRVNWIALPLILMGVSGLLFAGMRLALDRYKKSRPARPSNQST